MDAVSLVSLVVQSSNVKSQELIGHVLLICIYVLQLSERAAVDPNIPEIQGSSSTQWRCQRISDILGVLCPVIDVLHFSGIR